MVVDEGWHVHDNNTDIAADWSAGQTTSLASIQRQMHCVLHVGEEATASRDVSITRHLELRLLTPRVAS